MLLRHAPASLALAVAVFMITALATSTPASAASFADTAGTFYDQAVTHLLDEGVVQGCGNGEFCPARPVTRGQFATMLVTALALPPSDGDRFPDTDGTTHGASINALAAARITQGCSAEAFCPDSPITRAQMASMLVRAFDPPPTSEAFFDDTSGIHAAAVDRLAAVGVAAGCGDPLTAFCPDDPVLRGHSALFVARAMDLVDRVELAPLEERRAEQAALDAERQRLEAEERERLEAEERERLEAEARTERDKTWDDLAQCESGGNWSINTGNGYYGGLQFSLTSWRGVGGNGYPHNHSREEQIYRGERLLEKQGWGAWPSCSRQLGYR